MATGSDIIHDFNCQPCSEGKLNNEASFFCTKCAKYFCTQCVVFHNGMYKTHAVLSRDNLSEWGSGRDHYGVTCSRHDRMQIETYCTDHDTLCCKVCHIKEHKACPNIQSVQEMAKDFQSSKEFKEFPTRIKNLQGKVKQVTDKRQEDMTDIKNSAQQIEATIDELAKSLIENIKLRKEKTKTKMDEIFEKTKETIKSNIDSCNSISDTIEIIDDNTKDRTDMPSIANFILFKNSQAKISDAESLMDILAKQTFELTFQEDDTLESTMNDKEVLGMFNAPPPVPPRSKPQTIRPPRSKTLTIRPIFVQLLKQYGVQTRNDENPSKIVGLCELENGNIAVADAGNKVVKLFSKSLKLISVTPLRGTPKSLCKVSNNECAVLIENDTRSSYTQCSDWVSAIVLKENSAKLCANNEIYVNKCFSKVDQCADSCIASNGVELFCAGRYDIISLSMDGKTAKHIYESSSEDVHIFSIWIASSDHRVFAALNDYSIDIIDTKGKHLYSLDCSNVDYGCHGPPGVMLVTKYDEEGIFQMDETNSESMKIIIPDNINTRAIWFNSTTWNLYIGQTDDRLLVIKLSQ